jgi:hypothetical protein|tara:strand:+ start:2004 stop:2669 length:666 start_codon:yes stop_codon:yes gene_type:complete
MRIDEIDSKHSKFKEVILDHELTEKQLDEVLPLIGAIAGAGATAARVAGGAIVRGATSVARGAGTLARATGRTIKKTARNMAPVPKTGPGSGTNNNSTVGQVGKAIGNLGTDLASQERGSAKKQSNNQQSLKTNTAQKLSQKGSGQGTIGTQGTQGTQQTKLARGQEFSMPVADPNSPNKTMNARMKVKNVTGSEIELQPSKRTKGLPKTVKYNKKDLALK